MVFGEYIKCLEHNEYHHLMIACEQKLGWTWVKSGLLNLTFECPYKNSVIVITKLSLEIDFFLKQKTENLSTCSDNCMTVLIRD